MSIEPSTTPILEAIAAAIAEAREGTVAPLSPTQTLAGDLGLTSLEIMKVALALERRFGIVIEEGAEFEIQTVGDLEAWLMAALAEPQRIRRGEGRA